METGQSKREVVKLRPLPQFRGFFQKARYKAALGGRGRGASTAMAQAIVTFATKYKNTLVVCARQYMASIADSSKAQIEEVIYALGVEDDWNILEKHLEHKHTKSKIIFKGLEKSVLSIKSIPNISILAIEEAESVTQKTWSTLIPSIRKRGSEIWVVANNRYETDPTSQFFLGDKPPKDLILMTATYLENPYCSAEFIEDAELLKAKDRDLYNHVYLGHFANKAQMRLVKTIRIEKGTEELAANDYRVIGVDIAGTGGDKTVIAVRKGKRIVELTPFDTMDLDTLIVELTSRINRYNPHIINIDSTGFGALAPQALRRAGITVVGVNFADGATNKAYSNRRTEMYGRLGDYMQQGGTVPNESLLLQELEQSNYTLDKKNRMQMMPKEEIKKLINRSPDRSDAVALTTLVPGENMFTAPNVRAAKLIQANMESELLEACSMD